MQIPTRFISPALISLPFSCFLPSGAYHASPPVLAFISNSARASSSAFLLSPGFWLQPSNWIPGLQSVPDLGSTALDCQNKHLEKALGHLVRGEVTF